MASEPVTRGAAVESSPTRNKRSTGPHPFLRGVVWWVRIPARRPPSPQRSLETRDKRRALAYCRMLRHLADQAAWPLLEAISDGRYAVGAVYDAWGAGRLPQWIEAQERAAQDIDLNPYVDRWFAATSSDRPETATKYLAQLRTLIPSGERFPRSRFTKAAIREWLDQRTAGTRNHYRSAASVFARYLQDLDLLDTNVVRDVRRAKVRTARMRYLSSDQARALVDALPAVDRAFHAFLIGTGCDAGPALLVKYRDLDLKLNEVRVRGTKTHDRDRVRRLLHPWCADILRAYVAEHPGLPAAPLFPLARSTKRADVLEALRQTLQRLRDAMTAVELTDYTTRDHRHTFAVQALRDGYSYAVVAHQLGHANTALAHRVYGKFAVTDADYVKRETVAPVIAAPPAEPSAKTAGR